METILFSESRLLKYLYPTGIKWLISHFSSKNNMNEKNLRLFSNLKIQ